MFGVVDEYLAVRVTVGFRQRWLGMLLAFDIQCCVICYSFLLYHRTVKAHINASVMSRLLPISHEIATCSEV